jgi:hypothetical protein
MEGVDQQNHIIGKQRKAVPDYAIHKRGENPCFLCQTEQSTKNIDRQNEAGVPCLNPRACEKLSPATPFTRTLVEAEDRMSASLASHREACIHMLNLRPTLHKVGDLP